MHLTRTASSQGRFRLPFALFLLQFVAVLPAPLQAAQIFVTTASDAIVDGDGCSVREAVINANTNSRHGSIECVMGDDADAWGDLDANGDARFHGDVIILPPEKILLASPGEDEVARKGDLDISSHITIKGGGGVWTILDASRASRLFDVHDGGKLALDGVQLLNGLTIDDGGAVLVRDGGLFQADYVQFRESEVAGNGSRGGALFVASHADALVRRSDFSRNVAGGTASSGGGIACDDGCTLRVEFTTFTANRAAEAGGNLYISAGGQAALFFSTVANGIAPAGPGISNGGDLSLYASLVADNGVGSTGADLLCVNAAAPGTQVAVGGDDTFVEAPVQDCALPPTFDTRAMLPATTSTLPETVFYAVNDLPFQGAPGVAHRPRESFSRLLEFQTSPTASYSNSLSPISTATISCPTIRDQHGRNHRPGIICSRGAVQFPNLSVWSMSLQATAGNISGEYALYVSDLPLSGGTVLIESQGAVEDLTPDVEGKNSCNFEPIQIVFEPGKAVSTFHLPTRVFNGPALDRPKRVCNLYARLLDGDADAGNDLNGGLIRVKVTDRLVTAAGFSTPLPGRTLTFGRVAVSAGGTEFLRLTPDAPSAGFHVTSVVISGADASRFAVDESRPVEWMGSVGSQWVKILSYATETAPGSGIWTFSASHNSTTINDIAVPSSTDGGVALPIRCLPGRIGDFQAELAINTDSATFGNLVYGVKCSAGQVLSVVAGSARIDENDTAGYPLTLRLDTHALSGAMRRCLLDGDGLDGDDGDGVCLAVRVIDTTVAGAGSATARTYDGSGNVVVPGDYEPFAQTVEFAPGETEKTIVVHPYDDGVVDGTETISYLVGLVPGGLSNSRVTLASGNAGTLTLIDDDQPSREVSLYLRDIPSRASPGEQVRYKLLAHNRGTETAGGVGIEFVVEQPMWVRSIGLTSEEMTRLGLDGSNVSCSVATSKRRAICTVQMGLLFNQRAITTSIEDDEAAVLDDWRSGGTLWQSRKDWIEFTGVLVTADMRKPPTLDVNGMVSASLSAGEPASRTVATGVLTIDAPAVDSSGGPAGALLLGLSVLLSLRRRFSSTGGRNIDR